MTELASISNNHLALECSLCGHNSQIAVADLLPRVGRDCTVQEVVRNARCTNCRVKGQATFRIVFFGGSGDAMLGARQRWRGP